MTFFTRLPHYVYYLLELLVLFVGFFLVYIFSPNHVLQEGALITVLALYTLIGILHHKLHHNLRLKIVIEYAMVAILIFATYLFLNIGKL